MRINIQKEPKDSRWEERSKVWKQNTVLLLSVGVPVIICAIAIEMMSFHYQWSILATFQCYILMLYIVISIQCILYKLIIFLTEGERR